MFVDCKILEEDIKNVYDDFFDYFIDDIEGMISVIVSMSVMNEFVKVLCVINMFKERYNLICIFNDKKIFLLKEKIDIEKIYKIFLMFY